MAIIVSMQMIPADGMDDELSSSVVDLSDIPVTEWPEGFGEGGFDDIKVVHEGPDVFQVVYSSERSERTDSIWGAADSDLVLILVDSALHPIINVSLQGYIYDLEVTGYSVKVINGTWSNESAVRSLLNDTLDEGLSGAVLIGDIIEAWYEMDNPSPWGHEEFPIDYYYMDLDGTWGDSDTDGKFDSHTGDTDPEIWIGRLRPSVLGSETNDMENYLKKNHDYKIGNLTLPHNSLVYIDDDWAPWAASWNNSVAMAYSNGTLVSDGATTIHSDYENRLTEDHESVLLAAHSHTTGHVFKIGNEYTGGSTSSAEIKSIDPNSHFYNLFCCSGCRYTSTNNIGTQYVFADTYGLLAVGSTKTGSMLNFDPYYSPLGGNKSFGEAFKAWMKVQAESDPKWFYGMTLLGDPTLTTIHDVTVLAPEVRSPTHPDQGSFYNNDDPIIQWSEPDDLSGISGYYYLFDNNTDTVPDPMTDQFTTEVLASMHDVPDGTWYFHIVAEDTLGNIGAHASHFRLNIDTTPPTGVLMINNGDDYTANRTVALNITGADANGVGSMRFSADLNNWTEWEDLNESRKYNLTGPDGISTIFLELKDRANLTNTEEISDSILLDTTAPSGNITINNGDMYTNNNTVHYDIDIVDISGIQSIRMRVPGQLWGQWEDFQSTGYMTFSPEEGEKEIQIMLMDNGGLVSDDPINDTIILDTTPPTGTLMINDGSVYTSDPQVIINIYPADFNPVTDVRLRGGVEEWGEWMELTDEIEFNLTHGDGVKTVFAEIRDAADLVSNIVITNSIRLDTVPPNGSLQIMKGDGYTTSKNVTLDLHAEDRWEISGVSVSNDGINWSSWMSMDSKIAHVLEDGDGEKRVHVRYLDGAGLISPVYNDTIILDTTIPGGSIDLMSGDGYYLSSATGEFQLTPSEEAQLFRYKLDDEGWTVWISFNEEVVIPLGSDGGKKLIVQIMDMAGLISMNITTTCYVDTASPELDLSVDEYNWYGDYDPDMAGVLMRSSAPGSPLMSYYLSYQDSRYSESHDLMRERIYQGALDLNWSLIPEGRSEIIIGLLDTAGNERRAQFMILKDTTDPVISIPFEEPVVDGDTVEVKWAPADPTSDISSTQIIVDEGDPVDVDAAPDHDGIVSYSISGLEPGMHTIRIVVTDHAGNTQEELIEVEIPDDERTILPILILISIIILLLILGLIGYFIFGRSRSMDEE